MPGLDLIGIARAIGIRGGIIIALCCALIFVIIRADGISDDREDLRDQLSTERAEHKITRASVDTLTLELGRFVGAGKAARAAQLAAIEAQADDSVALQRQADAIRAELAGVKPGDRPPCDCATPKSIINAEGL
jgi:hypothetical protein